MLTKISDFFVRFSNGRNVLFFLTLFIGFNTIVFPYFKGKFDPTNTVVPLDLRMGFTKEEAFQMLDSIGKEGRSTYYFTETLVDSVYPFVYTLFSIFTIGFLISKVFPKNHNLLKINILPIVAMIFDFCENFGIVSMLRSFPEISESMVQFTSVSNILKWTFAGIQIVLMIVLLISWGIRGLRK